MTGDDPVNGLSVAQEQAAGVVEALADAGDWRLVRRADGDGAADEGVMAVVLAEEGGEGRVGLLQQRCVKVDLSGRPVSYTGVCP